MMGASADLTRRTTYWLHRRKSGAALLWCFGSSNCKVFHLRTSAVSQRREESHQLLTKMFEHFSLGNLKCLKMFRRQLSCLCLVSFSPQQAENCAQKQLFGFRLLLIKEHRGMRTERKTHPGVVVVATKSRG